MKAQSLKEVRDQSLAQGRSVANGIVRFECQVNVHQDKVDVDADIDLRIPKKLKEIWQTEDPFRVHQEMVLVKSRKNAILKRRASQDMPNSIRVCQATEETAMSVHSKSRSSAPPIEYRNDVGMQNARFKAFPDPVEKFKKGRDRNVVARKKATNASNQERVNIKRGPEKGKVFRKKRL